MKPGTLDPKTLIEAQRLTQEGRLMDATALLMGARRAAPAATSSDPSAATIDLVPPATPGGAWTQGPPQSPPRPDTFDAGALRSRLDALRSTFSGSAPKSKAGATAIDPRFTNHRYTDPAGQRDFKLYVPTNAVTAPMPLIVMLHGCTQTPDDFAAGTQMNALAQTHGFLVAYPAQTRAANAQGCWNWFNPADQRRDSGEPALIAGITRQVMAEHAVDPARVFVAGLSAGGAAAAVMAMAYPELYAGVGIHSGLACGAAHDVMSALAAMREGSRTKGAASSRFVPTIVFHGDRDATVNPLNGEQAMAQVRAAAAGLTPETLRGTSPGGIAFTRTVERDETGVAQLEHWRLHSVGHAWSGGSAAGSYTEPRGPNASAEMVRFFLDLAARGAA